MVVVHKLPGPALTFTDSSKVPLRRHSSSFTKFLRVMVRLGNTNSLVLYHSNSTDPENAGQPLQIKVGIQVKEY